MNLLVTNIGRRSYFVNFLVDLKKKKKNLKIFLADHDIGAAGMNIENTIKLKIPLVSEGESKYFSAIKRIISNFKINLLIPCTNYDLNILSKKKKYFEEKKCILSVSSHSLVQKLLDKKKTYRLCKSSKINIPKIYEHVSDIKKSSNKKFIKKRQFGYSSKDIKIIFNPQKKDFEKNFIVQNYISGNELHFDILNNFQGNFVSCCVKKKLSMRDGETYKAITLLKKKYVKLARKISKIFKHVGNLDCDAIEDKNGKVYFIDFNPRFGGGYPFTHHSGFNYLSIILSNFSQKNINSDLKPKIVECSKGISIQVAKKNR